MTFGTIVQRLAACSDAPPRERGDLAPLCVLSARDLARCRLAGALDCATRDALPDRHLVALADRLDSGEATDDDLDLLAAFDAADLKAAGTTAVVLIQAAANLHRPVARAMAPLLGHDPDVVRHAAKLIALAGAVLAERLRELPDAWELRSIGIGIAIANGTATAADLVCVRAWPAGWLRTVASARDFAHFADYRMLDF